MFRRVKPGSLIQSVIPLLQMIRCGVYGRERPFGYLCDLYNADKWHYLFSIQRCTPFSIFGFGRILAAPVLHRLTILHLIHHAYSTSGCFPLIVPNVLFLLLLKQSGVQHAVFPEPKKNGGIGNVKLFSLSLLNFFAFRHIQLSTILFL
jgi:hypothetical protein